MSVANKLIDGIPNPDWDRAREDNRSNREIAEELLRDEHDAAYGAQCAMKHSPDKKEGKDAA